MMYRSKAPLRVGFAGGGTDTSPFSDLYGGAILNATVSLYAYATLTPRTDGKIVLRAVDRNECLEFESIEQLPTNGELVLHKGVYNRIVRDYAGKALSFELSTYVDAPAGSGMGTSSTLVVAMVGAFTEWLKLPLGEYDMAHLAYEIERSDLDMAGGKQDQYSATFGGFNFMEFYDQHKVIVNPLRVKQEYVSELEFNIVLYNTGTSRLSHKIIEAQSSNIQQKQEKALDAMHKLKEQAVKMKEAVLKGELHHIGEILDFGWQYKKRTAEGVTNASINDIYEIALSAGATGGKVSGAGGGGFMFFFCPGNSRFQVMEALRSLEGDIVRYQFVTEGLRTWTQR